MRQVKNRVKASTGLVICAILSIGLIAAGIIIAFVCRESYVAQTAALGFPANGAVVSNSLWALVFILIALGVTLAAVFVINTNTVVKPLYTIREHFQRIASGDLHTPCPLDKGASEIGQMVSSANEMQQSLNRYIQTIETVLQALANGDLSVKTDQSFSGDFTRIRDALERITASFAESFTEINSAAVEMSSGAEQISIGASSLSEGSTEQAATIEELVATMSEVSHRVAETAISAEKVRDAAGDMMTTIRSGSDELTQLTSAIDKTGEYSEDISKIIKVIDGIAFQTNILALNAAVEAARATDNGAAFGVVAEEVRSLANQVAENSKAIASLIENTLKALSNGVDKARSTQSALVNIVNSADNVRKLVGNITEAMESDSAAMEESLDSLEQLSAVVQTNSATAEESAAASQEIAAQSFAVMQLVGKFKR